MDEGRFGLKVWFRKGWCARGERPKWMYESHYEWLWVYVALEPKTGNSFFLLLPRIDSTCLQLFADRFGKYIGERKVGLVLDGAGSHRSGDVHWPQTVDTVRLPPYSPELNPAEQVFRYLRARLSNQLFGSLDALESALTSALERFWEQPQTLQSLTGYPWWLQAIEAIAPSSS